MANYVKKITVDESNLPFLLQNFHRPGEKNCVREKSTNFDENEISCTGIDPYRAKFLQIVHPALRQLRACTLSPGEKETVKRDLLELLLYWKERELERLCGIF